MIQSYWKSVNIGDPKLIEFFQGAPLVIEEKVDGSQFSFGKINGVLHARSRSKALELEAAEKMFRPAVEYVKSIEDRLPDNLIFRGECLTSVKHNTIKYSRVPNGFVALFGADSPVTGEGTLAKDLLGYGELFGMDVVPTLFELDPGEMSPVELFEQLNAFLPTQSFLGGATIEGVVIKRARDPIYFMDRPIFAKLVSEAFRETHKKAWRETNPAHGDIIRILADELATPQRFEKAIQHLREAGRLENGVRDIGNLIGEVRKDINEECSEYMKEKLFAWASDKVARIASNRVPEWYKKRLEAQLVEDLTAAT